MSLRFSRPLRWSLFSLSISAVLSVAGCSDSPLGPGGVATLAIIGAPASLIAGDTIRLTVKLADWNRAPVTGVAVRWSTDNAAVAVVSEDGLVTGVSVGTTSVRAVAGGANASASLTVTNPTPLHFAALTAGPNHTCGLTADGALYCWGLNNYGQLGWGGQGEVCGKDWAGNDYSCSSRPVRVQAPGRFTAVGLGPEHTCGLLAGGAAYCWGANDWDQLGTPWDNAHSSSSPLPVAGQLAFQQLNLGGGFSCGLTSAGEAYCWGSHGFGELGTGDLELFTSPKPVAVAGGHRFKMLAGGSLHACGLLGSGQALCWGDYQVGELGIGRFPPPDRWPAEPMPTPVVGGLSFASIGAGFQYTCGLTTSGAVYCWGEGSRGRLGNGEATNQASPVRVAGNETFVSLTVGSEHACATTADGRVGCWGNNQSGQLGVAPTGEMCPDGGYGGGGTLPCASRPVYSPPLAHAFSVIVAGGVHSCALGADSLAYCWGSNAVAQLGNGFLGGSSSTPVRVLPPLVK